MSRSILGHSFRKKAYTAPGTLTYIGEKVDFTSECEVISYNNQDYNIEKLKNLEGLRQKTHEDKVNWVRVKGFHDIDLVKRIGDIFDIHSLILEDIVNTHQTPKFEYFDDSMIFLAMKIVRFDADWVEMNTSQICLILKDNYVISFNEGENHDIFDVILNRIKSNSGKIRQSKADYLFYLLTDIMVDNYGVLMETLIENFEDLEIELFNEIETKNQNEIYSYRKNLLNLRKLIIPLQKISNSIFRDQESLFSDETLLYMKDLDDHILHVIAQIETAREMMENIQNIRINNLSQRMNSVMKTLTVFSAIFMPLTFIAGVYGMNFINMPELNYNNGYFITLGLMGVIGVLMWFYFKWKKYM